MKKSNEMVRIAYEALSDKKAEDIRIIDISNISILADYFIVANGSNKNQISALVDNVEEMLAKNGYNNCKREGNGNDTWILLDYGDIIVHIFDKENRLFYDLERIWNDGKKISIDDLQ